MLPLLVSGAFYRPLTLVIIVGLVSVSALALFVVFALYLVLTPANAGKPKSRD